MVALPEVISSNGSIHTHLPPDLVAVFVGGTSGIGEAALKSFSKHVARPRVYVVGRSRERAERILQECQGINADGSYSFLQADLNLMANVDDVCAKIKEREAVINLLFLSNGGAEAVQDRNLTSEGLNPFLSVNYYSRTLFAQNLLPLLQKAASSTTSTKSTGEHSPYLARVVTVAGGGKEGKIQHSDLDCMHTSIVATRSHVITLTTLSLESLSSQAGLGISFVHCYPGYVQTRLFEGIPGWLGTFARTLNYLLGTYLAIPIDECGERMTFVSTSGLYGPGGVAAMDGDESAQPQPVFKKDGNAVYSITEYGGTASLGVYKLLEGYRADGSRDEVWEHFQKQIGRIRSQKIDA